MNSGPVRKTRQIESWSVSHSFMKTHHFDDLDPGDADDISVPQFVSACGQPAPHPVDDVDYDDALGHSHLASHYLARAKDCFENGENKRAGDHLNKAMAHFVQAHSALKAAHCSKCGNFLPASAASHRVAKALIVAKVANQEDDVFGARLAISIFACFRSCVLPFLQARKSIRQHMWRTSTQHGGIFYPEMTFMVLQK
jgi:hypothetical protein